MYVVIAGGGRTGTQLAKFLLKQGHEVHLIEDRREVLSYIHKELPTESIHEGNPLAPGVLEQSGIQDAQVLAACTTRDDINLLLCYIARIKYHVGRTIARVNNPRDAWMFDEKFHVDVQLNQAEIMANMIQEEMSMGDMMTLLKLRRGNFSLVEEKIPAGAQAVGRSIKDLDLPEGCVIAGIIRHGDMVVPRGQTVFEVGDEVLAITDQPSAIRLAELFGRP